MSSLTTFVLATLLTTPALAASAAEAPAAAPSAAEAEAPAVEGSAAAEVSAENLQAAIAFLQATDATKAGVMSMSHLLGFMKERRAKDVDPSFWEEMEASIDYDDLAARMAVVYAKHLSTEELQAATAFYNSPAGRALVEKQQVLNQEATVVGQAWSQENMARISRVLQERTTPPAATPGTEEKKPEGKKEMEASGSGGHD